jgi:diguanylate cyclase (GGDEF)-like protein
MLYGRMLVEWIGRLARPSIADANEDQLLEWMLEVLNVARDNKALVVTRGDAVIHVSPLTPQLLNCSHKDLIGRPVTRLLMQVLSATPGTAVRRWETTLKVVGSDPIAVEVLCQPLSARLPDVQVYAIRDLRQRLGAEAERDRNSRALQERERELELQNMRFNVALKNMCQGLCMFDANERIVIANDRYAEMYGLTPEQVKPGTTFRQILELRIGMGAYGGSDPEAYIRERIAAVKERHASTKIQTLSDGRVISISHQPMADGGWVATHQDITEQRRSEAKIAHMAHHDALTDLPNRALLGERLDQALARVERGEMVATHLLDLDMFKNVNDTLGHAVGDKLLKAVAGRLTALARQSDTVARMGGDEFAIVQVALEEAADATTLAERVISSISEPFEIDGHHVVVGTSVGIAIGPNDGTDPDQLLRNADLALYRAKGEGRGVYKYFEPGMDVKLKARRAMETDMRKALASGEFELHYQPVVCLADETITGLEALIRWRHPERGLISPGEFIPLAEEIGLIVGIGEWAIRQACATAAFWPDHTTVAVNVSPKQFRHPGLVQVVVSALATSGLPARRLELEITESVLLEDGDRTLATLFRLRELGVRIAMDDFGTGYSSLSYLQSFPFDRIKIDRSFVKDITVASGSLNIVRAVAAMAKGLGMAATAEGVETQEQMDTVKSEGCTEMQGFFFSKPRPSHEIDQLLLARGTQAANANAA